MAVELDWDHLGILAASFQVSSFGSRVQLRNSVRTRNAECAMSVAPIEGISMSCVARP